MKKDVIGQQERESYTGKIIIKPYDDPASPYAKGKGTKPEEKSVASDTYRTRIAVVCPYSQFNIYFESTLPSLVKGSFVDVVDRAEISLPPYIDVQKREQAAEKPPLWIIDFERVIARQPRQSLLIEQRLEFMRRFIDSYLQKLPQEESARWNISAYPFTEQDADRLITRFRDDLYKATHNKNFVPEINKLDASITLDNYVDDVIDFDGYTQWASKKPVMYITTTPQFSRLLREAHGFDANENFNPSSVDIKPYVQNLSHDLEQIANKSSKDLRLLMMRKRGWLRKIL